MRRVALAALALALAGCAAPLAPPAVRTAPPAPSAAPPAAAVPGAPAAAVRDSSPSPEALAVLASIPEPLGGAPGTVRPAQAPPDGTPPAGEVPVPAPTRPLAAPAPLPASAPPPTAPAPGSAAPPVTAAPPAAVTPAAGDTCWRVQVAAPADREKGKAVRDAAESLLMVPMIVDREGGRFKVRSRDCLSRRAAESLRDRAAQSGFPGVFLVRIPGTR